jgi:hypothetical protein
MTIVQVRRHACATLIKLSLTACAMGAGVTLTPVARAQGAETGAVRNAIKAIWDKPGAPVEVDPVTVVKNHALAGWIQEKRGGRALLRLEHGKWTVIVCAGDGLVKASALQHAGISPADATALEKATLKAEAGVSPERRKMFALFEGLVRVDASQTGHGGHAGHTPHALHGGKK